MKYFEELPRIAYPDIQSDDVSKYRQLTNLLTRSGFLQEIVENTGIWYDYEVKEGETPEIIADKLYGSVERFWLVLLFNKLHNPYYDFPLDQSQLESYIESKYGYDVTTAQNTHDHYERWVYRTLIVNGVETTTELTTYEISGLEANSETGLAETIAGLPGAFDTNSQYDETTEVIDSTTSVYTAYVYRNVSVYYYENQENEKKRKIKLLDAQYAGRVEQEFKKLMSA